MVTGTASPQSGFDQLHFSRLYFRYHAMPLDALALEPMTCGAPGLPGVAQQDGFLTLTYRKSKTATDLTYTVLAGDNLGGDAWSPATSVVTQTDPTPGGGSFWLVTVRDSVPHAGQARRCMRLQVAK
jgi:hypothetical protein